MGSLKQFLGCFKARASLYLGLYCSYLMQIVKSVS